VNLKAATWSASAALPTTYQGDMAHRSHPLFNSFDCQSDESMGLLQSSTPIKELPSKHHLLSILTGSDGHGFINLFTCHCIIRFCTYQGWRLSSHSRLWVATGPEFYMARHMPQKRSSRTEEATFPSPFCHHLRAKGCGAGCIWNHDPLRGTWRNGGPQERFLLHALGHDWPVCSGD
jgi:hypothetical protein